MRSVLRSFAWLVAAMAAVACSSSSSSGGGGGGGGGGGTTIAASSYDQSCASDIACVGVFSGDACAACHCPNDAIAASAEAQYQNDLQAKEAACPSRKGCTLACTAPKVRCVAGKCTSG